MDVSEHEQELRKLIKDIYSLFDYKSVDANDYKDDVGVLDKGLHT